MHLKWDVWPTFVSVEFDCSRGNSTRAHIIILFNPSAPGIRPNLDPTPCTSSSVKCLHRIFKNSGSFGKGNNTVSYKRGRLHCIMHALPPHIRKRGSNITNAGPSRIFSFLKLRYVIYPNPYWVEDSDLFQEYGCIFHALYTSFNCCFKFF